MKVERSNIEFPLWRKKVDSSLLKTSETPIPNWLHSVWSISLLDISKQLQVDILFNKKRFSGKLRWTKNGPNSKQLRFSFESGLGDLLKEEFLMSYMRSLEGDIRKSKNMPSDLEKEIPFWEFIDIEFDVEKKTFYFTNHYSISADFQYLYSAIKQSQVLHLIDEQHNFSKSKIFKSDWLDKKELKNNLDVKNVIYYLIDKENKEIYIGQANSLTQRLSGSRNEIPNWTHYRFDKLPNTFSERDRVLLERFLIRGYASLLKNSESIESINISDYVLKNKVIDKN